MLVTTATTGGDVLFSSSYPFLHRERKILAYLGQFWHFRHKFMHFLVPLLQALIVWRCPEIDKYQV